MTDADSICTLGDTVTEVVDLLMSTSAFILACVAVIILLKRK